MYYYFAVAQFNGKPAGRIQGAEAKTREECERLAREQTQGRMSFKVKRGSRIVATGGYCDETAHYRYEL